MYVDMHAHILPGADHGSDSIETSLLQVKSAVRNGISIVCATPHYYNHSDTVSDFLERRSECRTALDSAMNDELKSKLQIVCAAEVTLEKGLDELDGLEKLCIGNTRNILIELPDLNWDTWVIQTLENIVISRKLKPIIAHIDRYWAKHNVSPLIEFGLPFQINISAYNNGLRNTSIATHMFRDGTACFLGSDIHMRDVKAYEHFAKVARRLGSIMNEVTTISKETVGL